MDWLKHVDLTEISHPLVDFISFESYQEGSQIAKSESAICFREVIDKFGKITTRCWKSKANKDFPSLDSKDYFRWIDHCRFNGLIPLSTDVSYDTAPRMTISPDGNYNRAFSAACCYRWAINHYKIPSTVLQILDVRPSLNFFQALHFALKKFNPFAGHSFINVSKPGLYNKEKSVNLKSSLGLSWFYNCHGRKLAPCDEPRYQVPRYTSTTIESFMHNLGYHNCPSMKPENILKDEFAELYNHGRRPYDEVKDFIDRHRV